MRVILFAFAILLFAAQGCNTSTTSRTCAPLSGRYINSTVLDKCPGTMPQDIPHFAFQMTFSGKDSVLVDNGFEKFNLVYSSASKGDECRYTLRAATLFGDMDFIVQADSTIQLLDTAWTKLTSFSTFTKSGAAHGNGGSFDFALNNCLLAGEYAVFKNGNLQPRAITILPNGQLNGFRPYLTYAICYAGDCLEETEPAANTIDFTTETGGKETFVFKLIEGKMAIELYSIGPPIPDIKGGRSIGPMVYELRTE